MFNTGKLSLENISLLKLITSWKDGDHSLVYVDTAGYDRTHS